MADSVFAVGNVMTVSIEGLKEAQDKLANAAAAVSPDGGLNKNMAIATGMVHRYLMSLGRDNPPLEQTGVLPVVSGRLKNSLYWFVKGAGNSSVGRVTSNIAYGPKTETRRLFMARAVRDMREPVNRLIAVNLTRQIERKS